MFNISNYLEKFKTLYSNNLYLKDTIVKVVKEITGIEVDKEKINYKNGILILNLKPIQKSELFLKKSSLLKKFDEVMPNKIIDLR
jgi:hypothetical protein